ncbi:Meiotically up-regulated protein 84 protein [Elsinoe australis]|uniref:Meiotically up-regulated protein 84 protein n=1 Tax=Elsinoe australis TaxID=40998 RepID=A0A2P8A7Q9_9PEZI|nr:Meiotically up-regulated protein 84 protein [Elsinoe australis]
MPPQSRGNFFPNGAYSKSTPNLPTLRSLDTDSSSIITTDRPTPLSAEPNPSSPTWTEFPTDAPDHTLDSSHQNFSSASSSSSSDETATSQLPLRPYLPHSSRSQTHLPAFAPPFYNRPPTPLPPSPSLTSLLRPNFSANASRPTTPSHSSDDAATAGTSGTRAGSATRSTAAALTTSFRTARPIPRASPKVPTYEYYGFTLYLASSLIFLIYLLWSFLPSPFLHQLGIYYYPNRWWSLAIPAWLVMCVVWIYVALAGWNTERETLRLGDVRTVTDEAAMVAVVDSRGRLVRGRSRRGTVRGRGGREDEGTRRWREVWSEGTDAVMDIPVGGVCEVLYGVGRDEGG